MKKMIIEDRQTVPPVQSVEQLNLSSTSATAQLRHAVEQEKARRVSRSRPLEVVHYQPGAAGKVRQMLERWHLLFFARTGSTDLQELRGALQQGREGDEHLLKAVEEVKGQYREHMAQYSQAYRESVQEQEVIAEIRYGGMSLISGFWLPEEMEMGLALLPKTGARLPLDALSLVEHCLPTSNQALSVLLVTAPVSPTKAELASEHLLPIDSLGLEKRIFTLSTPFAIIFTAEILAAGGAGAGVATAQATQADCGANNDGIEYVAGGAHPSARLSEENMQQQADRVRALGRAPSVSQLVEARQHLLTRDIEPQ